MKPRSYPQNPVFETQSERDVWNLLMNELPSQASIICNLHILETNQEYELDFVVAWPEVGISVIEVKGGRLTPNSDATFTQVDAFGVRDIDPIFQIGRNVHAVKNYVIKHSSLSNFSPRPTLVFPYSTIPVDYQRPEFPRCYIFDELEM